MRLIYRRADLNATGARMVTYMNRQNKKRLNHVQLQAKFQATCTVHRKTESVLKVEVESDSRSDCLIECTYMQNKNDIGTFTAENPAFLKFSVCAHFSSINVQVVIFSAFRMGKNNVQLKMWIMTSITLSEYYIASWLCVQIEWFTIKALLLLKSKTIVITHPCFLESTVVTFVLVM